MALTLAERFARYATKLRYEDLPDAVVHEVKRRVIDSFATAVGAMDAEAYAIAKRCALRVQSEPGPDMFGGGTQQRRMGHVRQRAADPLPRLQRHISLARAGPSQRQPRPGAGSRRKLGRRRQANLITAAVLATKSSAGFATRPASASRASTMSLMGRSRRPSPPAS